MEKKFSLEFKNYLKDFVEQLSSMMKDYADDKETNNKIEMYHSVINVLNEENEIDKLINNFIKNSYPYWKQILSKDERFFIDNCDKIFGNLDNITITKIKNLFKDEIIKEEDKEIIWEYLKILINISCKYVHHKRGPKIKDDGKKCYNNNFMKEEINMKTYEKLLNINIWENI